MADQKLLDEVGKYIDQYYEPVKYEIKLDKEMFAIFESEYVSEERYQHRY